MVSSLEDSSLEDDSVTDHDSETDLWDGFDFPQLTAEEDAQHNLPLRYKGTPRSQTLSKLALPPQALMRPR